MARSFSVFIDWIVSWVYIHRLWGPRCPDHHPDCYVCQHWKEHDELFEGTWVEKARKPA